MNTNFIISKQKQNFFISVFFVTVFAMSLLVFPLHSVGATLHSFGISQRNTIFAKDLAIGDYINDFGNYNGNDLRWRVISKDEQGVMIRTERVLSNADGVADLMPYSDTSDAVPDGYPHKSEFVNQQADLNEFGSNPIVNRVDNGTNFWAQSTARYFLQTDFLSSFNQEQMQAIVSKPSVETLLWWVEVVSALSGTTTDITYMGGTRLRYKVIGTFTEASNITGKPTQLQGRKKQHVPTVFNYDKYSQAETHIYYIYDNAPYYMADDMVFFAPTNILLDLNSQLKNPNGERFTKSLDFNNNVVVSTTSTPITCWYDDVDYAYGSRGPSGMVAYDEDGNVRERFANTAMGYQPCIYLDNDTLLSQTGQAPNIPNETGTYYDYILSPYNVKAPEGLSIEYAPNATLADIQLPTETNGVWKWKDEQQSIGDVGYNTFDIIYTSDDGQFEMEYQTTVEVKKADGQNASDYVLPQNLTAGRNVALSTVALPVGWEWDEPDLELPTDSGEYSYKVTFMPFNSNYEIVEGNVKINIGNAANWRQ